MAASYLLSVHSSFSAAHALKGYKGACESLHGHNWEVELQLSCGQLDELGLAVDFEEVKAVMKEVLGALDHKNLSELPLFGQSNASAENIAAFLHAQFKARFDPASVRVAAVKVTEAPGCSVSYSET